MPPNNLPSTSMSRPDQMKKVALMFTHYLIEKKFISIDSTDVPRSKLLEWYSAFQNLQPSHVKSNEIVKALHLSHILKRRNPRDGSGDEDLIEFKKLFFECAASLRSLDGGSVNVDDLMKPNIRVFINESSMFKKNIEKSAAVEGLCCRICKETFLDDIELEKHESSEIHKLRDKYRTAKNKFIDEIEGLVINKIVAFLEKGVKKTYLLKINNILTPTASTYRVLNIHKLFCLNEVVPKPFKKTDIPPGGEFVYEMEVYFPQYGAYEFPIVITIENKDIACIFDLLSVPTFRVMKEDLHDLGPSSPYEGNLRKHLVFEELPLVEGVPLEAEKRIFYKVKLGPYDIPLSVTKIINRGFKDKSTLNPSDHVMLQRIKKLLCSKDGKTVLPNELALTEVNYFERFQVMLHIEEYQQNRDMLLYNREDAELVTNLRYRHLYGLNVPGLAEGRPSILKGDKVFIRLPNKNFKYEGIVHLVQENVAYMAFGPSFNYINKQKVNVEFSLNRVSLRICHRALHQINSANATHLMFPYSKLRNTTNTSNVREVRTKCKNKQIEENENQWQAVQNIVLNTAYPAPYIIYGPPGTGKTLTMVEAIAQLHLRDPKLKICACAPSNTAANVIASRLVKNVPRSSLLRLYGMSYSPQDVPEDLRDCSNYNASDNDLVYPTVDYIKSKSILIVTPISAGRVYGYIGESYFDYLFIDEAGQGEETLTLVPMMGLLKQREAGFLGSLVLVGDPKQLGPLIHSKLAIELGLQMPMMERLMKRDMYKKNEDGTYDTHVITKLTYNYRSHRALLEVPNQLFYDGELVAKADRSETDWLCGWEALPNKNIPLIFHSIKGRDDKESTSPSYFNQDEIGCIGDYLQQLIGCRVKGRLIQQQDIVILTPYRKQVQKVRQYLTRKKWENVGAFSVEMFQGQEKPIVILSTVRSRKEFIPEDYKFGLGFLANPKRFNVAITRAKALMIIVGNPDVLQCDHDWKQLIRYCQRNNCYQGSPPEGDVSEDVNAADVLGLDLSALTIAADRMPESETIGFMKDE